MAWIAPAIGAGASLLGSKKQADAQTKALNDSPFNHLSPDQQAMYSSIAKAIGGQLNSPGELSVAEGGLTGTEQAYKDQLMGDLNASPGVAQSVKDAMFRGITSRLDEDARTQTAAMDQDMIRRGFGLNSGEGLNRLNAINMNRQRVIADAGNQVETYADQTARQQRGNLMGQLMGFSGYERGNQQAALDRGYNARDNSIRNAMGFAGLNSGMAQTAYSGRQNALGGQAQAYGNLGAWGAGQMQGVDWRKLMGLRAAGGAGGWGSQPNDDTMGWMANGN